MEGFLTGTAPGLEAAHAPEGSANATFLGAANFWHARASQAEAALAALKEARKKMSKRERLLVMSVGYAAGLVVGFVAHWLVVLP